MPLLLFLLLVLLNFEVQALTLKPGLWLYRISTDLSKLPKEQHENFQAVEFERCLNETEIQSGHAMQLQTTSKSADRCENLNYEASNGKLSYRYQCDGGSTLMGSAKGSYSDKQFRIQLLTEPKPSFDGIALLSQTFSGQYKGPCK